MSPGRLLAVGLVLLAATAFVLWAAPSTNYLLIPDRAKALAHHVEVEGEKPDRDGGGIYYVDVIVRKASLLERFVPSARTEGADLIPAHALRPPGVSEEARRKQELHRMSLSQRVAAAVALRALGYRVAAKPVGARVAGVRPGSPAAKELEPTEVIVEVDGKGVRGPDDLRRLIRTRKPGDTVRIGVRDGRNVRRIDLRTVPDPEQPRRPVIGVAVEQAADIKLPLDVRIDIGDVGGPSAGLAFALDIAEELGRDVDRGYRVAATGELALDGTVGPIGGVEQKTLGAMRSDVDVFLVPAGENTQEARRHARGLRVIGVSSFQQALRELATLAEKP